MIKINEHNGQSVVSARELHSFLEAKERFSTWCTRMFKYGFVENMDYVGCKVFNTLANQELQDYALTLDTAKEISMLQRSEKGKQARQYFIECENRLKNQVQKQSGDAIILQAVNLLQERIKSQEEQLKTLTPKADFADRVVGSKSTFPITVIAKELGMTAQALNQLLHEEGVQYRVDDCWVLYKKYQSMNLVEYKTEIYGTRTYRRMEWTEYGRAFIINKVQPLARFEPMNFNNILGQ